MNKVIMITLAVCIVLFGCTRVSSNVQVEDNDILHGTMGLLLVTSYDRRRAKQLLRRDGGDMLIVDGKTGRLYVTSFLSTKPEVLNDLFSRIKATGFYQNKKAKPIFTIKAKVKISKPVDWETESSGWGTVDTPFKAERGVVIKEILDLKLVTTTKPRDCYEKGHPCSVPEYRKFENYCRPYLGDSNKKLPDYILNAPPCYNYFEKLKEVDQRMKENQKR